MNLFLHILKRYCFGRSIVLDVLHRRIVNKGNLEIAYIDIYHNNHILNILWYKVAALVYLLEN